MLVATLIAKGNLTDALISEVVYIFQQDFRGADRLRSENWIDHGFALDLPFEPVAEAREDYPGLASAIHSQVSAIAAGGFGLDLDLDVIVQPVEHRHKKLLVADMDSTIIGQECIDELADYAGFKPEVAAITERAMQGELDFGAALKERVALLKGLGVAVIGQCLTERIRLNPGAETLVRTMRAYGSETILVSGGFTAFVAPIAKLAGFDRFEANVLSVRTGKLTGTTEGRIVDASVKRDVLVEARQRLGLSA